MAKRWLIVGGSGMLGHSLCKYLVAKGQGVFATESSHAVDLPGVASRKLALADPFDAAEVMDWARADVVVYAAGLTNVDACESNEALAQRLHADAAAEFAAASVGRAKFVYISTDHLWDGTKALVAEEEPPVPINAYARTKLSGEVMTFDANPETLALRTNFFGKGLAWRSSISDWMLARLGAGEPVNAFVDSFFTPIAMPILSEVVMATVERDLGGIYNCCGRERVSKFDFARRLARHFGHDDKVVVPARLEDAALAAPRPLDMSLSTARIEAALGRPMPDLAESFATIGAPS